MFAKKTCLNHILLVLQQSHERAVPKQSDLLLCQGSGSEARGSCCIIQAIFTIHVHTGEKSLCGSVVMLAGIQSIGDNPRNFGPAMDG